MANSLAWLGNTVRSGRAETQPEETARSMVKPELLLHTMAHRMGPFPRRSRDPEEDRKVASRGYLADGGKACARRLGRISTCPMKLSGKILGERAAVEGHIGGMGDAKLVDRQLARHTRERWASVPWGWDAETQIRLQC